MFGDYAFNVTTTFPKSQWVNSECCEASITNVTNLWLLNSYSAPHDDVIKWKHFPRCWPFVRGIHRSPVNSPHKGQWRGSLIFYLICAWINGQINNSEAGDLRCHRAHYGVIVMSKIHEGGGIMMISTSWSTLHKLLPFAWTNQQFLIVETRQTWIFFRMVPSLQQICWRNDCCEIW